MNYSEHMKTRHIVGFSAVELAMRCALYIKYLLSCLHDMIYLLTAIGLSPGGSTHLHTTTHRTIQNNNTYNNTTIKQQHNIPYLIIFLLFDIQLFIHPIIILVLHCFNKIY